MATQLTKNFTIEELIASSTATARKIDNTPNAPIRAHLQELASMLQSLREAWGGGIKVSSAYRCPKLNSAVGGASNSMHMQGYAADINPSNGDKAGFLKCVLEWAKTHNYDQIILEQCDSKGIPSWIHIGVKHSSKGVRKQKLTAKKVNGKWAYSTFKG